MNVLSDRFIQFTMLGLVLGTVIGVLILILVGGGSSSGVGDRLNLTADSQTTGFNIPLSTVNAVGAGWIDPTLCSPGRGRYFTKADSSNLIVLYNNDEHVAGVYLSSDTEMPEPWRKIDSLKGGGGIELIGKEHWGLYAYFNDPIQACKTSDSKSIGTGGIHSQGAKAVRSEYQPTPTPTTILGVAEILIKISESISSDSRTFTVMNATDQTNITTGIKASQVGGLISNLGNAEEGTSKWIDNISHRGISGDLESTNIAEILTSAESDNLKVSLWVNDDNQVNFIEITGIITYEGKEFSKLNMSPE